MKIRIDPKVVELFPDVKVGVLLGKGMNNQVSSEGVPQLQRAVEEEVRKNCPIESLVENPKIVDWREAYRKFGFKSSLYRSSIEALLRRILKDKDLPAISPLVDLYNLASVKHRLPAGGDDIDNVAGDIVLSVADGSELFVMLGAEKPEEIKAGEIVYRDDKEVLCRAWNYRECEKSKITAETNATFLMEGLKHSTKEEVLAAINDLKEMIEKNCGGTFQTFFLDKDHPEAGL